MSLLAFTAGFLKSAGENVKEKNKEISDAAVKEFERLQREAMEQNEKIQTKRDELKSTASVLASYKGKNNTGFTQGQIISMLQNPAVAKRVQSELEKYSGNLDQVDFAKLYQVSRGQDENETVEGFIDKSTRMPTAPEAPEGATVEDKQVRGAFGLPSRAYGQTQARFEKATGTRVADLRAQAQPRGVPSAPVGSVDFGQLRSDTVDKRINQLSIQVLDAKTPEEAAEARTELDRVLSVKSIQKQKEEGGVKESDVRSNFRILSNTIMQSMAGPGDLVLDKETNTFMYSRTAKPEVRAKIEAQKRKAFETSELTKSYRTADGKLPPEVSRVMSAFIFSPPSEREEKPTPQPAGDKPPPSPTGGPAQPAAAVTQPPPAVAAMSSEDKQQTVANARAAVAKINADPSLSRGQKNGRLSIIRQRLREAGIDPNQAGL
jgi:hypothetical protein